MRTCTHKTHTHTHKHTSNHSSLCEHAIATYTTTGGEEEHRDSGHSKHSLWRPIFKPPRFLHDNCTFHCISPHPTIFCSLASPAVTPQTTPIRTRRLLTTHMRTTLFTSTCWGLPLRLTPTTKPPVHHTRSITRTFLPPRTTPRICLVDLPCASTLPNLPNVSQLCAERVQSVPALICRICSRVSQLLLHTDSADQCGSVRIACAFSPSAFDT